MKTWWRCEGEDLTDERILAHEDVLAVTCEFAAIDYAVGAGEEGRAEAGSVIRVNVVVTPGEETSEDVRSGTFDVAIEQRWRGTVVPKEARLSRPAKPQPRPLPGG